MNKYETDPEWLDSSPRLREDVLALKRLTAPETFAVTWCQSSESMTAFCLLVYASGQKFRSGL